MSYLVLARKYRPQTFDQVVKQEHVTKTLCNAVLTNRMHHAILFSGPRGTGKTTVARILAKAMNCKNGPTANPCNVCRSCKEITSGNAVDVFEIDGASNNSVDRVRELRENAKYMPAHSSFKIYIIDEVHMLSQAAFNALLKTLEEPPSRVMFIFATTEPHKIPVTILSRCQRYDFRRIGIDSVVEHMKNICGKEGFELSDESLGLIAAEAGGCMRDALSLLDQVMACAGGEVKHDQVVEILGIVDRKIVFEIAEGVISGDIPNLLKKLDDIYYLGHDLKKFYTEIIEHFRNLLIVKMGKRIDRLVDLPAHEIAMMHEQVKDVSLTFLDQIFDSLFQQEPVIKHSENPKLALEMVFIRLLQIKPSLPIDLLIEKLDNLNRGAFKKDDEKVSESKPCSKDGTAFLPVKASESFKARLNNEKQGGKTTDHEIAWTKICGIISKEYPHLAANLKKSAIKELAEKHLEIEVNGSKYNIDVVNRKSNISIIKNACKDYFGKEIEIAIKSKEIKEDKNQPDKNSVESLKQKALNHPLVTDALEIFKGEVVEVKLI